MSADRPALLGGPAVRPQGPPDWPPADEDVRAALESAWRDGSWGRYHGGHVARLEEWLATYHGVAHALSCGSGTFAVELALRALKVGPGDEVILAAYDYPGNFLSVHAVGATPVLVDVHPRNWNLDPEHVAAACGPATKAVIASHLHGGLVPMSRLREIAERQGMKIVEDACQCPGALVDGRRAGAWGDVGVLSFGGSKLLTAGRGGAIITSDAGVHQRARLWQNRANVVCPLS
jgi:dTDP-4-amino-4,6-dideoxygalactose transaminase